MAANRKKNILTTTRVIMLGFLVSIIVGAVILSFPISLKEGVELSFTDALFTSTTSVCVTGLTTVTVGETFSLFGQAVIMLLIQFGGLGIVTFTTIVLLVLRRRITLSERLLIQSAYNLDTLSGLVHLTKRIVKVTLIIELIGALGYSFVFIPEFGFIGIWYSVFHSVSAFCNAGIDLLGDTSLIAYKTNVIVNFTTIFLIIVSGIGFPVYWEVARSIRLNRRDNSKNYISRINTHAKLVLAMTAGLILLGTLFTFIFEYNNPDTIGNMNLGQKLMASLFQSVTLRTAGFATIDQSAFTHVSCLIYIVWMFIGGSPAGTAGGVKTVTVALVFASMMSNIAGRKEVTIFKRKISDDYIRRAVAIVCFSFTTLVVLTIALMYVQDGELLDTLYEMTSAIATVGLTRGVTGMLNGMGKFIVMLAMYLGRIGPITLALAFNSNRTGSKDKISYAEAKVTIG